jgi:hypothetical protein
VDSCQGGLLSRRDAPDFVPEGPDDRSQAIYCLEYAQKRRTVPAGRCESGYTTYSPPGRKTSCRPNHIVPYGTGSLCDTLQAINCLTTIIPSLRDNDSQDPQIRRQISDAQPRIVQTSLIVLIAVRHSALDLGLASEASPVEDQQKRMSRSSSLPAGYFFAYICVQFAV